MMEEVRRQKDQGGRVHGAENSTVRTQWGALR